MSSSYSTANKKKQQDEQNLKLLRELASLLPNKQCFDCHQRGPTYVNMTVGSFVCTKCSGLLRGLNPPYRVKSISMATFTTDEIELLKSRGNEYCRRVWVGRYDRGGRSPLEDISVKDDTQMKDHLILKYEKKRWYLSPSEAFANSPPPVQHVPSTSQRVTSSASSQQPASAKSHSTGVVSAPPPATASHPHARPSPQQQQSNQDLLSRNMAPAPAPSSSVDVLFDPFGTSANFGSSVSSPSGSQHLSATPFSNGAFQQTGHATPNMMDGGAVPKSATVPSGFLLPSGGNQLQPISAQQQHQPQPQQKQAMGGGDKYSALAELDDLFRSTSPVDASFVADKRQPAPAATGGGHGNFGPLPTSNQFYSPRPPAPVTASVANPFAAPPSSGQMFTGMNQQQPVSSSVTAGFGVFQSPPQPAPMQQAYRPHQQQFAQMPQTNPFANPAMNPTAPTGNPSWNPFL